MSKKPYDPLQHIPSASILRTKLSETEALAERLRILLGVAERIEATQQSDVREAGPARSVAAAS